MFRPTDPTRANRRRRRTSTLAALAIAAGLLVLATGNPPESGDRDTDVSVIVQAESASSARRAVEAAGGTVTHDLGILHAVGAFAFSDSFVFDSAHHDTRPAARTERA